MSANLKEESPSPLPENWHGRAAVTLTNGVVEATVLPGGGHLARWGFVGGHGAPEVNTLWEAPWPTADPSSQAYATLVEKCGLDKAAARFLAAYTGHALCLDGFGPPTPAEEEAGGSLHGEASTSLWDFTRVDSSTASGSVELPVTGLRVERQFSLLADESVLRVEERVTNLRDAERSLHWVQHATFGAPFATSGSARATASLHRGMTWPLDYEGHNLLARDAAFTWPYAPGADGKEVDLRKIFIRHGTGLVAAAQQAEGREHGFVAVCDEAAGLAIGYVFRTESFPWVTLWEENGARRDAPWLGAVQARGMEFGTTPLPLGNEVVDARGPLLGTPTSRRIAGRETLRAPWLLFAAAVPQGWREIEDILVERDEIVLVQKGEHVRVKAQGVAQFLEGVWRQ